LGHGGQGSGPARARAARGGRGISKGKRKKRFLSRKGFGYSGPRRLGFSHQLFPIPGFCYGWAWFGPPKPGRPVRFSGPKLGVGCWAGWGVQPRAST